MPETTVAAKPIEPAKQDAPPGPARGGPVTSHVPRALFVVLTRADDLLEQIGRLLDESSEVRHAEHEDEARRCMDPRHATVMLLDAREHADPGPVVERLHSSDGTNVIVVFAPANAVAEVARAIRGSAAFAVLPIPLESEKTAAVLHGAGEEALARRALLTPAAEAPVARAAPSTPQRSPETAPERPVFAPKPVAVADDIPVTSEYVAAPAAGGERPRAGGIPRSALLAAAGLLVAAGAAWLYLRDDASPAQEPVAAVAPATSVTDAQQAPAGRSVNCRPNRGKNCSTARGWPFRSGVTPIRTATTPSTTTAPFSCRIRRMGRPARVCCGSFPCSRTASRTRSPRSAPRMRRARSRNCARSARTMRRLRRPSCGSPKRVSVQPSRAAKTRRPRRSPCGSRWREPTRPSAGRSSRAW